MHVVRRGSGKPLLLVHGLGGSWRSWQQVTDPLVDAGREVIAVDLPGHGWTPALEGETSICTLADELTAFLREHDLLGIDAVGGSMGARLVMELARRGGVLGAVVALDPGGFWQGWEVPVFFYSVAASGKLVRLLQPVMPVVTGNAIGRTLLFAQFSARPWDVPAELALDEMRSFAQSPVFDELLRDLAYGEVQKGAPRGSIKAPLVIGWGRQDRVCLPQQAARAQAMFPDAEVYWFEGCGHFPQWDRPKETVQVIMAAIEGTSLPVRVQEKGESRVTANSEWKWAGFVVVAIAGMSSIVLWLNQRKTN